MPRTPATDKRPGWHWSDYWRTGRVDVMTVDAAAGGSSPFDPAPFWRPFFQSFESGARILDLATGGGQVARIGAAAAQALSRQVHILGVDYAELAAPEARQPPGGGVDYADFGLDGPYPVGGFELLGGIALERLPFPTSSFDGATSQFGIEYADVRAALGELARVLRPSGRALMLVHHRGGAVGRWAADQLAAFDRVAGEGAALRQARRVFSAHRRQAPPDGVRAAEAALRDAVERMAGRLKPDPAYAHAAALVDFLGDLAREPGRYAPASALARLDQAEAGDAAWRQRLKSQVAAALDARGVESFLARARRAGLDAAPPGEALDANGEVIGWRLEFVRA